MKRSAVILLLLVFPAAVTRAQTYAPVSFETAGMAPSSELPGGASMRYTSFSAGAAIPFRLGKGRFIAGLRYDHVGIDYDEWPSDVPSPDAVHHPRLEMIFMPALPGAWEATLLASPGWASDFDSSPGARDFNLALAALIGQKLSDGFTAGLGLSYVKDRAPVILPLVRIFWQSAGRWSSEIIAPSAAHFWYQLGMSLQAGLAWRAVFLPYNLHAPEESDADWLLRRQVFAVGPALRIPITGAISLQAMGGTTLRNRLVFVIDQATLTVDHDSRLFVWAGLVIQTR